MILNSDFCLLGFGGPWIVLRGVSIILIVIILWRITIIVV